MPLHWDGFGKEEREIWREFKLAAGLAFRGTGRVVAWLTRLFWEMWQAAVTFVGWWMAGLACDGLIDSPFQRF